MYVHSVCMANPVPCCLCKDTGMPGKIDPKTKECLCKCFCDPPDNNIPSVKVSALFLPRNFGQSTPAVAFMEILLNG